MKLENIIDLNNTSADERDFILEYVIRIYGGILYTYFQDHKDKFSRCCNPASFRRLWYDITCKKWHPLSNFDTLQNLFGFDFQLVYNKAMELPTTEYFTMSQKISSEVIDTILDDIDSATTYEYSIETSDIDDIVEVSDEWDVDSEVKPTQVEKFIMTVADIKKFKEQYQKNVNNKFLKEITATFNEHIKNNISDLNTTEFTIDFSGKVTVLGSILYVTSAFYRRGWKCEVSGVDSLTITFRALDTDSIL